MMCSVHGRRDQPLMGLCMHESVFRFVNVHACFMGVRCCSGPGQVVWVSRRTLGVLAGTSGASQHAWGACWVAAKATWVGEEKKPEARPCTQELAMLELGLTHCWAGAGMALVGLATGEEMACHGPRASLVAQQIWALIWAVHRPAKKVQIGPKFGLLGPTNKNKKNNKKKKQR